MKARSLFLLAAAGAAVSACQGLKDAFNSPAKVVARAGSQELTVTRLADLVGKSPLQIEPSKANIQLIAGIWVDYQLLGLAAARNDSLSSPQEIAAAARTYDMYKTLDHFSAHVDSSLAKPTPTEAGYDAGTGGVYDARHILFQFPIGATDAQKDSVRRRALSILPQVTDANFAAMAKKYSSDPGTRDQGGDLGVFPSSGMVAPFSNAVAGLKPGQISGLVETPYGYHIIERLPYARAKVQYDSLYPRITGGDAVRAYVARLDSAADIQVKPGAAQTAKVATADPESHRQDKTVLATFKGGNLTVSRYLLWLDGMPPQANIYQEVQQAPDSLIQIFLHSLAGQEVMLRRADSLHIAVTPEEQASMENAYREWVVNGWNAVGVDPKMLADSASGEAARQKLAAVHVDTLMAHIMEGTVRPIGIPTPLRVALEAKYSWNLSSAGIDRAVTLTRSIRTTADSARAAHQPASKVPLPGQAAPGSTTAPAKTPPGRKP